MIDYDPTAIQKKVRIARAKRALKSLRNSEQLDKSAENSPSRIIYEWLTISLELRDQAVATRKARPDIFEPQKPDSAPEAEEDDEEDGAESIKSQSLTQTSEAHPETN